MQTKIWKTSCMNIASYEVLSHSYHDLLSNNQKGTKSCKPKFLVWLDLQMTMLKYASPPLLKVRRNPNPRQYMYQQITCSLYLLMKQLTSYPKQMRFHLPPASTWWHQKDSIILQINQSNLHLQGRKMSQIHTRTQHLILWYLAILYARGSSWNTDSSEEIQHAWLRKEALLLQMCSDLLWILTAIWPLQKLSFFRLGPTVQQGIRQVTENMAQNLIKAALDKIPSAKIIVSGCLPRWIPTSMSNNPNIVSGDLNKRLRDIWNGNQRLHFVDQISSFVEPQTYLVRNNLF